MAYNYAARRALQIAKLRAAGIDPGTNPRAAWEALDPATRRYATTQYARRHPGYQGGGAAESRPAERRRPVARRRPFHERKPGVGDVYWTNDLRKIGALIRAAGPRRQASLLVRLWVIDHSTDRHLEGWRSVYVGDAYDYLEALEGPEGSKEYKTQLILGPGGDHAARRFQAALDKAPRSDGKTPPGRVAVMAREVVTAGGFSKYLAKGRK